MVRSTNALEKEKGLGAQKTEARFCSPGGEKKASPGGGSFKAKDRIGIGEKRGNWVKGGGKTRTRRSSSRKGESVIGDVRQSVRRAEASPEEKIDGGQKKSGREKTGFRRLTGENLA